MNMTKMIGATVGTIHSPAALREALAMPLGVVDFLEVRVDHFMSDLASLRAALPKLAAPKMPLDPAVVAWVNEYGPNKTRIFSTSLGHNNATVADDRYLDLVTRGLLWAAGRLGDDGSIPATVK